MPESIEQYYELSFRERALIAWACCEHLVEADEVLALSALERTRHM